MYYNIEGKDNYIHLHYINTGKKVSYSQCVMYSTYMHVLQYKKYYTLFVVCGSHVTYDVESFIHWLYPFLKGISRKLVMLIVSIADGWSCTDIALGTIIVIVSCLTSCVASFLEFVTCVTQAAVEQWTYIP